MSEINFCFLKVCQNRRSAVEKHIFGDFFFAKYFRYPTLRNSNMLRCAAICGQPTKHLYSNMIFKNYSRRFCGLIFLQNRHNFFRKNAFSSKMTSRILITFNAKRLPPQIFLKNNVLDFNFYH